MIHMLLILGIVVLIVLVMVLLDHAGKRRGDYDERQVAARGGVYKVSFGTLLCYNLFAGGLDLMFEWNWAANTFVFAFIGALLGLLVFVVLSIWNNAYFRTKDGPVRQMILLGLVGIGEISTTLTYVRIGRPLVENGQVQFTALPLGLGIVMVCAWITFLLRRYLDKKAEAKDAEEE